MKLTKYHGLGNEFLIALLSGLPDNASSLAVTACDSLSGPGADGLIIGLPSDENTIDVQMVLFNADGTSAEISGNGLRCLAHHVHMNNNQNEIITILTEAGIREARIEQAEADELTIKAGMGIPTLGLDLSSYDLDEKIGGAAISAGYIDVGNPHIVIQFDSTEFIDIGILGSSVEKSCSEEGINVHVIEIISRSAIKMLTWERGVGITKACGTGAVASACKALSWGLVNQQIEVIMPGGDAQVTIEDNEVYLMGKSKFIKEYEVDIGV